MIIRHVTRCDKHDYDQYSDFVVVAGDETSARALLKSEHFNGYFTGEEWPAFENGTWTQIGLTFGFDATPRVVCASYHAG